MDLQRILLNYFTELDPDVSEVVTDVYSLERSYMDYYGNNRGLLLKIKDVIDRVANVPFQLKKSGKDEN